MNDTQTIRCLIIDDEPPAREIIRRYVQEIPSLQLMGECANAIQALTVLQQQSIDLLFLDIRMPQLNGTDFIKTLKNPPKVIFTTAFAEYALEGYELDVVDFLMKPIRFDRFLKAVNKAYPVNGSSAALKPVATPIVEEKKNDSFVYFRADRKMVKVFLEDILFIESLKDYIKVVTTQKIIISKQSIASLVEMLPKDAFVRVHRSYIIAINKIDSYNADAIEI